MFGEIGVADTSALTGSASKLDTSWHIDYKAPTRSATWKAGNGGKRGRTDQGCHPGEVTRYIAHRVLLYIPTLPLLTLMVFLLMRCHSG